MRIVHVSLLSGAICILTSCATGQRGPTQEATCTRAAVAESIKSARTEAGLAGYQSYDKEKFDYSHLLMMGTDVLIRGSNREKLEENHSKFSERIESRIARLSRAIDDITTICSGLPPNASILERDISTLKKERDENLANYSRQKEKLRIEDERTQHYSQQKLSYSDSVVSVAIQDIRDSSPNDSYNSKKTTITLRITSASKTKILPNKAVDFVQYDNARGGKEVAPIIVGITVSDEHGNAYKPDASSDHTDSKDIRPDRESQLTFSIDTPIDSARFLILKIAPGTFANSKQIKFKAKRFIEPGERSTATAN